MLRAVLFDFDGVIVDTEPLHWAAMNEVLSLHALTPVTWEHYRQEMLGLDDRGLFAAAFAREGKDRRQTPADAGGLEKAPTDAGGLSAALLQTLIEEKSSRFLERAGRQSIVLPGAAEFIESLSRQHLLAICSGALRREIEVILETAGLRRYFRVLVSSDDVRRGKPDPQGYLLALQRLREMPGGKPSLRPGECLVVEDSYPGIEAAKEAGMTCLAVATTVQAELLLEADAVVDSLRDVEPGLLDRLFAEE